MRIPFILVLSFLCQISIGQFTISETYNLGDMPTSFDNYDPTCNGAASTLNITIPAVVGTALIEVVGVDISYNITAPVAGSGYRSDQRSQVYCVNTATLEADIYSGTGEVAGTQNYSRSSVDIANGDYSTGDVISFELRAWRDIYEGIAGCNDVVQRVDNGTWSITVYFNACPPGVIFLGSQASVDQFIMNYGSCTSLPSDLFIQGTVTDLSGLSNITSVGGLLRITNADLLTSLNGLNNIESIGSYMTLQSNDLLTDFTGLNGLTTVTGDVTIRGNSSLVDLTGLGSLADVGPNMIIDDHGISLTSLNGLNSLSTITGNLLIENNSGLINCAGLNNLNSVQGILEINANDDLTNLLGLNSLTTVNRIDISKNSSLTTLSGLNFMTEITTSMRIESNDLLSNFSALSGLTTHPQVVDIWDNDSMLDLDWFSGMTNVSNFSILNNDMLSDIQGLSNLIAIDSSIIIQNNISLASLQGIENITQVGQNFVIAQTPLITDLSYLENMTVGNLFYIIDNDGLTNLSGSTGLELNGPILIAYNSNMSSLAGIMDELQSINGELEISFNDVLTDISQLSNLYILSGTLTISNNPLLTECCILDIMYPRVFSDYVITDNNTGCETFLDIQLNCENTDPDKDGISTISDSCPFAFNPDQEDFDMDGIGNACDNCPTIANAGQEDANNNFIGDACEVVEPGKAGVNTTSPKSGFEIYASELYLSDTSRGLIMTNANGDCFRLFVDMEGNLQTKAIDCPN